MEVFAHEKAYRGADTLKKIEKAHIVQCGLGAIGSNLLMHLSRQGFQSFAGIDFDRIEDHNRHTQIWGKKEVGQLKAQALQFRLYQEMGIRPEVFNKRIQEVNLKKLIKPGTIFVDGFDNSEARSFVKDYCSENNVPCLHVGLSPDYAEIVWNENYIVPKKKGADVCEYPLSRNIVLFSVVIAADVLIRYIDTGVQENYAVTLKDFNVSKIYGG